MTIAEQDQTAQEQTAQEQTAEQIQQDIEATRSDMTRKLEALERKLAPRHIAGEVADSLLKAVAGPEQGIASMIDLVRRNPVPAALIGVGVGWLLFSGGAKANGRASGEAAETATRLAGAGHSGSVYPRGSEQRGWAGFVRNPVALGGAGLLLGAAAAYLLPLTEREAEWLEEAREELAKTVRTAGEELKSTAAEAASVVEAHPGPNDSRSHAG